MPTRNVVLTDRQARLVERLVASGRFQNASEVLREGIRLVEQRVAEDAARIEALRQAVLVGDADIEAGRSKALKGPALRKYLNALVRSAAAESTGARRKR